MVMHPFVYSCGLVGYAYGSSFLYTILENRLWWRDSVCGSGYGKILEEIWEEMLHGSSSSITKTLRNFQWNHCLLCLSCKFIGVLVVCMVLVLVVFESVGLIIVCFHGFGSWISMMHSQFVHGSVSGFRWFDKIYLISCLYCKWSLEMINEDQQNWKEMTNTMMKINKKAEEMFSIVHVMDRVRNFNTILK